MLLWMGTTSLAFNLGRKPTKRLWKMTPPFLCCLLRQSPLQ